MTASVSEIIARVQRAISLPDDVTLVNNADYVAHINNCLQEDIYPHMILIRDDYFLVRELFPLQNNLAQDLYPTGIMPIPKRAWANTLREVRYIDISSNYFKMNRLELENFDLYQTRNLAFSATALRGFIPFNSGIKLIPPSSGDQGTIEMHYIVQPSTILSDETAFAPIVNLSYNSSNGVNTLTASSVGNYLDSYCAIGNTALFDIYNTGSGMLVGVNLPFSRTAGLTYTNTTLASPVYNNNLNSLPTALEITNFQTGGYPVSQPYTEELYLVPSGLNSFSPIPTELDNWLTYCVAVKIMESQGLAEELPIIIKKRDDTKKVITTTMAHRIDGEAHVVVPLRGIRSAIITSRFGRRRS